LEWGNVLLLVHEISDSTGGCLDMILPDTSFSLTTLYAPVCAKRLYALYSLQVGPRYKRVVAGKNPVKGKMELPGSGFH